LWCTGMKTGAEPVRASEAAVSVVGVPGQGLWENAVG
jgi:hypothetical protein